MTSPSLPPAPGIAGRLADIAEQVKRLSPDWCNPERFYERRSEIAGELRRVAAETEGRAR